MAKQDVIKKVQEVFGLKSQREARDMYEKMGGIFEELVMAGEEVRVFNLGTMSFVDKDETAARNPKSGELIGVIPAHKAPKFKLANAVKNAFKPEVVKQ